MGESKIVTAVGVSANESPIVKADGTEIPVAARVQKAMEDGILQATEEGISTEEKNAPEIRERMRVAREKVMAEIEAETVSKE